MLNKSGVSIALRSFSRNALTSVSMIMMALSVLSFFAMFLIIKTPDQSQVHVESVALGAAIAQCERSAKNMGFSSTVSGDEVSLSIENTFSNTENAFALSTAVVSDCPGFKVKSMCVGSVCKHGLDIGLKFDQKG